MKNGDEAGDVEVGSGGERRRRRRRRRQADGVPRRGRVRSRTQEAAEPTRDAGDARGYQGRREESPAVVPEDAR